MIFNKIKIAASAILITGAILQAGIAYADDSEVFFGSEQFMAKSKPNILFLLDISGSMSAGITLEDGSSTTRIEALKDAVREVLYSRSLTGVNIGVMSFGPSVASDTSPGKGAQLIYPVVDIDQVVDEGSETVSRANSGKDDAHQTTITNKAVVDSNVMVIGKLGGSSKTVTVDLNNGRFDNVFLLPRASQVTYDDAAFSNALANTCSIILDNNDQDSENCKRSFLSKQGYSAYGWTHIIEKVNIGGVEKEVITGINGSAYNYTYGQKALFIFRGANIPADANISKAKLVITAKTDGFYKSNGKTFCTLSANKGEAEWLNWRISSARNFPVPIHDILIYTKTKNTISDFNFWPRQGHASYGTKFYNVRQNQTTFNNSNPGQDASTNWGAPQDGATCYWQAGKTISMNVTTALQEALGKGASDTQASSTYVNNFKTPAGVSGAPMADVAIRFWTGGGAAYSKPYVSYGAGAPKLEVTYSSSSNATSMAAVRFNNIGIPQGAKVTSAKVKLVPAGGSGDLTMKISGELSTMGDAKEFEEGENLAARSKTSASVNWPTNEANWQTRTGDSQSKYETTPDLSSILQEIVNKQEWCGNQSIALFFEGSGSGVRSAFSFDESTGLRPVIEVTYDKDSVPTNTCLLKNWEETLGSRADDGSQVCATCNADLRGRGLYVRNNTDTAAVRFPNTLIKSPADAGTTKATNKGLSSALLQFNVRYTDYRGDTDANNKITIVLDQAVDSIRLKPARQNLSNRWNTTYTTTCTLPKERVPVGTWISCDVTDLVRAKIQQDGWKAGNSMTFLLKKTAGNYLYVKSYEDGYSSAAKLLISAKDALMAPNSRTIRRLIVQEVDQLETTGITPTVAALYDAARYVTNVRGSGPKGPYHKAAQWKGVEAPSPLLSSCQSTHLVLMSDGEANNNPTAFRQAIVAYTGRPYNNSKVICSFEGGADYTNDFSCGRALVKWMNTTNQSYFADDPRENIVTTHAVGFTTSSTSTAYKFLNELAQAGAGHFYSANNAEDLVDAFMAIVDSAKNVNATYVSGQVSLSPQSKYDQRTEIFYSLLKPSAKNYWEGNMKRFVLKYVDFEGMKRAVLYDVNNRTAIVKDDEGVYFISKNATSWWTKSPEAPDGGDVRKGGVLQMQKDDPALREMRFVSESSKSRYAFSKDNVGTVASTITPDDLGVAEDTATASKQVSQGLVSFMRGYLYSSTGAFPSSETFDPTEAASKKIGDAARSAVTFASYGCTGDNSIPLIKCDADKLQQTLLLAGNDGFFRGYDLKTGEQLFAEIPQSLLINLRELQEATPISQEVDRLYGLDGTVRVFHDDVNQNGYIDGAEKAYAIVVKGRGGRSLYAFDISSANKKSPKLKWVKSNADIGYGELGYTWSVPVIGKVQVNNTVKNVLVFGGGYDPNQDNVEKQTQDNMGRAIYVVDIEDGSIISAITKLNNPNMKYSIPGTPAILTAGGENNLITDIFVGDMGGQLWRVKVANGKSSNELLTVDNIGEKGVVASISGTSKEETRRIYETPAIYTFNAEESATQISVNVGTGYHAHPLALYNNDRFYSFRFPKDSAGSATSVVKEADLAIVEGTAVKDLAKFKSNGFYIKFSGKGEKMVSAIMAEFHRVAFNTYIPNDGSLRTCKAGNGQQNAYLFDLLTGKSLFETRYKTSTIAGLPSEPSLYCDSRYCTISFGFDSLADDNNDLIVKDVIIDKCKEGLAGSGSGSDDCVIKTGWTDLFDPLN